MKNQNIINRIKKFVTIILIAILTISCSTRKDIPNAKEEARLPIINPDYTGIVIPPNCSPLNFSIKEKGENFLVQISSKHGEPIQVEDNSGQINIPFSDWKELLAQNAGENLKIEIYSEQKNGQWTRFNAIENKIATEKIDGYVAYRKFGPLFNQWKKMGIYQRNIENFDETPILPNKLTQDNCMNCHNFWQNGTDRWLLHTRFEPGTAMLLCVDEKIKKIDTRTEFNKSPGGYPTWHPSGNLIAFSVGKPLQFFHTIGETRDELDRVLDIIVYDVKKNMVTTTPEISSPDRVEVWPLWSHNGDYLYFCSSNKIDSYTVKSQKNEDSLAYGNIKFDLMRILYDAKNNTWGKLETVISSAQTGFSISQPKISPDGRFIVFTASSYGSFPIFHSDADLYSYDLRNGAMKRLELNSDRAEGFHSWSSNNRWLVYSSKRQDGQFTGIFISHIDSAGVTSKGFALPQEDPLFYETCLEIFNVPEMVKESVKFSPQTLARIAHLEEQETQKATLDPKVKANKSKSSPAADSWINTNMTR
ncbi:MAG: hypothetical protein V1720_09115 [bacterium]